MPAGVRKSCPTQATQHLPWARFLLPIDGAKVNLHACAL
jgi:hypothetical protein